MGLPSEVEKATLISVTDVILVISTVGRLTGFTYTVQVITLTNGQLMAYNDSPTSTNATPKYRQPMALKHEIGLEVNL